MTGQGVPPAPPGGNAVVPGLLGYVGIDIDAKAYTDLRPVEAAAKRLTTKT